MVERCRDDDSNGCPEQNSKTLHSKHSRNETTSASYVGVFGHDRCRQRVISSDAKSEPEAEEAKRGDNIGSIFAERKPTSDGTDNHQDQCHSINLPSSKLVAHDAEEKSSKEGSAQGGGRDGYFNIERQLSWRSWVCGIIVVDPSEKFGDDGYGEEVVSICEKSAASHKDGGEMIPLSSGSIKLFQDFYFAKREGRIGAGWNA